jgi:hypothetical protein
MSVQTNIIGFALASVLLSGVALGQGMNRAIVVGHPLPMLGPCAPGFTATPAVPNAAYPKGPGGAYTCTMSIPAPACNVSGYSAATAYLPAPPGKLVGPVSPFSPFTLQNGRLSYTCFAPGPPPK